MHSFRRAPSCKLFQSDLQITFHCSRRSEFLGCVSFPLKDAIKNDISGTYFLQGRQSAAQDRVTERRKMATDNTETSTNDGAKENVDKGTFYVLIV